VNLSLGKGVAEVLLGGSNEGDLQKGVRALILRGAEDAARRNSQGIEKNFHPGLYNDNYNSSSGAPPR